MTGKEPDGERMEPRIEVEPDPEIYENNIGPERRTRPTAEKKPITRWIVGPILAAALAGLGYAFWLTWSMEPSSTKTSPLAVEVAALRGEVKKLGPDLDKLKKEVEDLKIENRTTVDQMKKFQERLSSADKKLETALAQKSEPSPPPVKRTEAPPVRKAEPAATRKPEAASAKKSAPDPVKKQGKKTFVYKVRPGESVYSIGRKFGVDPDDIIKLNDLPPKAGLQAGQLLTIHTGPSR